MEYKKFTPLNVSSKFAICGLPLRVDTYKMCSFGCKYCFANCRVIMEFEKIVQIANLTWLSNKLDKVYNKNVYKEDNFLDNLLLDRITWHCGGMSDPFQPIENNLHITKNMIDITNKYNIDILFSTKSDNLYNANVRPDLHSFQFSVTNLDNRVDIEPNVAPIEKRYKLYKDLKADGFKIGIRVQPFLPTITKTDIVELFHDADYFTIEGIKIVPQNKEHKDYILKLLNISQDNFTQMGLLNLKPEIRLNLYKDFIEKLNYYNIPFSIADNDLHYISSGNCCCGDTLIKKSTKFNNTSLINCYGCNYSLDDVKDNLDNYKNCKCSSLFTSNRTEGCTTVEEFYNKRFERKSSPFSPKFQYINKDNIK